MRRRVDKRCTSAKSRCGLSLIETLVSIGLITLLLGLVVTSLQWARSQARLTVCSNHLRMHALGLMHYHDRSRQLPAGLVGPWGLSWHCAILADLDQQPLADQLRWSEQGWWRGKDIFSRRLQRLATIQLPVKQCPSQPMGRIDRRAINGIAGRAISAFNACGGNMYYAHDNLSEHAQDLRVGNGAFTYVDYGPNAWKVVGSGTVRWAQFADGRSQTLLLGETDYQVDSACGIKDRFYHYHPSIDDRRGYDMSEAICTTHDPPTRNGFSCDRQELAFGSHHPGRLSVSFADGSIRQLSKNLDAGLWRSMGSRSEDSLLD